MLGMNSTMYFPHQPHVRSASVDRPVSAFVDAHALTRKALERWENEGGRIPELARAPRRQERARREGAKF